jgi:hypothetical protein
LQQSLPERPHQRIEEIDREMEENGDEAYWESRVGEHAK